MDSKNRPLPQSPSSDATRVDSTMPEPVYPEATNGFASSAPVEKPNGYDETISKGVSYQPIYKRKVFILAVIAVAGVLLAIFGVKTIFNSQNGQKSNLGQRITEPSASEKGTGNFDFKVYLPKNYNGPMELTYARALDTTDTDPNQIPRYELFYTVKTPSGQQENTIHVIIYKGSSNYFNPPENCGNGSPNSEVYKSTDTYPCKVVMKTKRGREIHGYRSAARLQYYKVEPNSDDVKNVPPEIFYIELGGTVISFRDPAGLNYNSSLTPTVVEGFVDSLEPVDSKELAEFNEINGTPKSIR